MKKNEINDASQELENMSIEECFKEIERMIDDLNKDGISLEDSFEVYNKAVNYVKACNSKIDRVEKQIKIIENSLVNTED